MIVNPSLWSSGKKSLGGRNIQAKTLKKNKRQEEGGVRKLIKKVRRQKKSSGKEGVALGQRM